MSQNKAEQDSLLSGTLSWFFLNSSNFRGSKMGVLRNRARLKKNDKHIYWWIGWVWWCVFQLRPDMNHQALKAPVDVKVQLPRDKFGAGKYHTTLEVLR